VRRLRWIGWAAGSEERARLWSAVQGANHEQKVRIGRALLGIDD
jgi:hypothetical protein